MGRWHFWLALLALSACGGSGGGENSTPVGEAPIDDEPTVEEPDTGEPTRQVDAATFRTQEYFAGGGLEIIDAAAGYATQPTGRDGGDGVRIAIIDSGVDLHDDLRVAERFALTGTDFEDPAPHGTHVAGIAAARRNGEGVHGVAFDAEIVSLKIAPPDFGNENQLEDDGVIASAIVSAAGISDSFTRPGGEVIGSLPDAESAVMNMSFSTPDDQGQVFDAMARAADAGKIMVASLGNDALVGPSGAPAVYASEPEMRGLAIAVGALDKSGREDTPFSNLCGSVAEFCLFAPGDDIVSTLPNNRIGAISGTSMAAPHVAGAAATLLAAFPSKSSQEIVQRILTTAEDLGPAGTDEIFGRGRLDLGAALSPVGLTSVPLADRQMSIDLASNEALFALPAWVSDTALRAELQSTLVLDEQGFPFSVDLRGRIEKTSALSPLSSFVGVSQYAMAGDRLTDGISFTVRRSEAAFSMHEPWRAKRRDDAKASHYRLDFRPAPNLAFSLGRGEAFGVEPVMVGIAQSWAARRAEPLNFAQGESEGVLMNWRASDEWHVHANWLRNEELASERAELGFMREDGSGSRIGIGLAVIDENESVWGMTGDRLAGRQQGRSLMTSFVGELPFAGSWSLFGRFALLQMVDADRRAAGLIENTEFDQATSASLGISRKDLFGDDRFAFSVTQPFRPNDARVRLSRPVAENSDGSISHARTSLSLEPTGRQTDYIMEYRWQPEDSFGLAALGFVQTEPGHNADADPVIGAGLRADWRF